MFSQPVITTVIMRVLQIRLPYTGACEIVITNAGGLFVHSQRDLTYEWVFAYTG